MDIANKKMPLLVIAILLIGVLFRIIGFLEPLWLDELWTILAVEQLESWREVFTLLRIDNNHPLQSLWVYSVRKFDSPLTYRAFSLACSFGFLLLAFRECLTGKRKACVFFFLTSSSYVFTLYGTEVRGYSPMLFGCYLAFLSARDLRESLSTRKASLFAFGASLALLAHFSAVPFVAALFVWLLPLVRLQFLVATLALPLSVAAAMWFGFHAHTVVGGGDVAAGLLAPFDLLSVAFGGFELRQLSFIPYTLLVLLAALWLSCLSFVNVYRNERGSFLFSLCAILLFPLLLLLFVQPDIVYPRYFLPSLLALYLIVARWLAERRAVVLLLVCGLFLLTNGYLHYHLATYGRGDYREVIAVLQTDDGNIAFGQGFRHTIPLKYYSRQHGVSLYAVEDELFRGVLVHYQIPKREGAAKWLLRIVYEPEESYELDDRTTFELVELVPSSPLSGWTTGIYKRVPKEMDSPTEEEDA